MLLAGADPTDAVRLQLILLWVLLGSVAISALIATTLAYRNFFTPAAPAARAAGAVGVAGEPIRVGRRTVEISSPAKALFERPPITKLDLARHYERVADAMLPHVRDRPLALADLPGRHRGAAATS